MHNNNSTSDANKENINTRANNTPTNRVDININRNPADGTYYRAFASTDRQTLYIYQVKPLQDSNVHGISWRR